MQESATKFRVEVQGAPLSSQADGVIISAVVDDSLNLPDLFVVEFRDNNRDILAKTGIGIGSPIKISVTSGGAPQPAVLIQGEVTALETEYDKTGTRTIVRGFDPSHRLLRGRLTRTWQNATLSDVATDVARSAGLEVAQVDHTTAVVDHVAQANISNWDFLRWLGREAHREVTVVDGKFQFRESTESSGAPKPGSLIAQDPLQLKLGENLRHFRAIVTSAEQVEEIQARGWDVKRKAELVGVVPAKTRSAELKISPVELAQRFGSRSTFVGVDTPLGVQHEVDEEASALAEQIAGAFAEFDGVADGNPKLRAGTAVSLGSIGAPFEGKYVLTTTRHVYSPTTGYTTWFTVSGKQERSLLGLTSIGGNGVSSPAGPRIAGVVNALVTDVRDPEKSGRVRLKFPWLSNDYVSDWCRVVQIGAGENGRGTIVIPEVNDEVLVAFEQGDVRRPYVLGGLYNGMDPPRAEAIQDIIDPATGAVAARHFFSRKDHELSFVDKDGSEGIVLRDRRQEVQRSPLEERTGHLDLKRRQDRDQGHRRRLHRDLRLGHAQSRRNDVAPSERRHLDRRRGDGRDQGRTHQAQLGRTRMGTPAAAMGDLITGLCIGHQIDRAAGIPVPAPPIPFSRTDHCGRDADGARSAGDRPPWRVRTGSAMPPHVGLHGTDPFMLPNMQQGIITVGSLTVLFEGRPAAKTGSVATICLGLTGTVAGTAVERPDRRMRRWAKNSSAPDGRSRSAPTPPGGSPSFRASERSRKRSVSSSPLRKANGPCARSSAVASTTTCLHRPTRRRQGASLSRFARRSPSGSLASTSSM